MQRNTVTFLPALSLACIFSLTGCDRTNSPPPTPTASVVKLPADLIITTQPAGAIGVIEARKSATVGMRVAVIGRIGGSRSPFVNNRAIFTIVDSSLKSCAETGEEDHCPRPWDYCCEDKTALAQAMASIEISNASGEPLAISANADGTLKPLMLVAVEGVLQSTEGGSFLIRADHVYPVANDPLASKVK